MDFFFNMATRGCSRFSVANCWGSVPQYHRLSLCLGINKYLGGCCSHCWLTCLLLSTSDHKTFFFLSLTSLALLWPHLPLCHLTIGHWPTSSKTVPYYWVNRLKFSASLAHSLHFFRVGQSFLFEQVNEYIQPTGPSNKSNDFFLLKCIFQHCIFKGKCKLHTYFLI